MTLEDFLKKRFHASTTARYIGEINLFLSQNPTAKNATYKNIVEYIWSMRSRNAGKNKLQTALLAVKQYYFFLMDSGQRKDHPCRYMTLRDRRSKQIQLQDLFTANDLELLLERKERYRILEIRNRVVISLLIYQGLSAGELTRLAVKDINLKQGTIYIKSSTLTNSRTIGLQPAQIMLLHQYITAVRPKLASRKKGNNKQQTSNDKLILTWQGTAENGEGINYLISTYKKKFPGRNLNPRTIRQSVITNLLKQGKDLRIVQAYIGHKSPDTTEKYKQSDAEELQAEINKYHPMR